MPKPWVMYGSVRLWACARCKQLTEVPRSLCQACERDQDAAPPPPPMFCSRCHAPWPPCPDCEGSGTMLEPDVTLTEWVEQVCELCAGTGASEGPCTKCGPVPSVSLGRNPPRHLC